MAFLLPHRQPYITDRHMLSKTLLRNPLWRAMWSPTDIQKRKNSTWRPLRVRWATLKARLPQIHRHPQRALSSFRPASAPLRSHPQHARSGLPLEHGVHLLTTEPSHRCPRCVPAAGDTPSPDARLTDSFSSLESWYTRHALSDIYSVTAAASPPPATASNACHLLIMSTGHYPRPGARTQALGPQTEPQ